jgi:myo-inositol 2-dehydrogenase/D-chiro-inositol 1-dehydrogenase
MGSFTLRDPARIGVGVLGAGRIARRVHLRNLATIRTVDVVVVADPDPAAAETGRELARAKRASLDPMEAIHDPDVEAVVISAPTPMHAPLIEAALLAGKAVWTEKPIAQELAETKRIVDLWHEVQIPVQVGFMRRFDPGYVRAKELVDSGALGRIEQFRALSRDANSPTLEFLLTCGGSFIDMSVHDLDLARFLVGEVEEVHAWAAVLWDDRYTKADDWDTSVIMMRFRNGALGVVETARHSRWGYDIRAEIAGATGKVVVDGERMTPATHYREGAAESDRYPDYMERFEIGYRRELEAFFDDLAAGRPVGPGPDDAYETLRLAVACTRSWRENRPVRLDEVTS